MPRFWISNINKKAPQSMSLNVIGVFSLLMGWVVWAYTNATAKTPQQINSTSNILLYFLLEFTELWHFTFTTLLWSIWGFSFCFFVYSQILCICSFSLYGNLIFSGTNCFQKLLSVFYLIVFCNFLKTSGLHKPISGLSIQFHYSVCLFFLLITPFWLMSSIVLKL